jgi:hypothetical protein
LTVTATSLISPLPPKRPADPGESAIDPGADPAGGGAQLCNLGLGRASASLDCRAAYAGGFEAGDGPFEPLERLAEAIHPAPQ